MKSFFLICRLIQDFSCSTVFSVWKMWTAKSQFSTWTLLLQSYAVVMLLCKWCLPLSCWNKTLSINDCVWMAACVSPKPGHSLLFSINLEMCRLSMSCALLHFKPYGSTSSQSILNDPRPREGSRMSPAVHTVETKLTYLSFSTCSFAACLCRGGVRRGRVGPAALSDSFCAPCLQSVLETQRPQSINRPQVCSDRWWTQRPKPAIQPQNIDENWCFKNWKPQSNSEKTLHLWQRHLHLHRHKLWRRTNTEYSTSRI